MSGGKPFPLERLIAIFEAILDSQRSYSIGTTSILSSVRPPFPLSRIISHTDPLEVSRFKPY